MKRIKAEEEKLRADLEKAKEEDMERKRRVRGNTKQCWIKLLTVDFTVKIISRSRPTTKFNTRKIKLRGDGQRISLRASPHSPR